MNLQAQPFEQDCLPASQRDIGEIQHGGAIIEERLQIHWLCNIGAIRPVRLGMKNIIFFVVLGALLAVNAQVVNAEFASDWTLTSADGQSVTLSDEIEEQTVILFVWATWCPYCKALMPHLQSISHEYGDTVKILAVQIDDKGDPVEVVRKAGYDFTVLPGGKEVADLYGIFGTPGLLIIDKHRQIRFDLRDVPSLPEAGNKKGHDSRAAKLAPYWAAALRTGLDSVLQEAHQ